LDAKKQVYTAPRLKEIYAAPRLIERAYPKLCRHVTLPGVAKELVIDELWETIRTAAARTS
jgi:hypothetical protein